MKGVFQTTIDPGKGDCHRAVVASLFDLDITQVPNFILFDEDTWFDIYNTFIWAMGFQYEGCCHPGKKRGLLEEDSINGFFDASVPSRTFAGKHHAVVINQKGLVVHDPNPNKRWLHENVLQSGELRDWYMFSKREKSNE